MSEDLPRNKHQSRALKQDSKLIALKMRGLPYRVQLEDVQRFFDGYKYDPKSILLGEDMHGRKTGYAAVLFQDEAEAERAMEEKQGHYIG